MSGLFASTGPLSNVPLLGWSLLEYRLSHLAASGVTEVLVLASDRPDEVRALAGDGARWGLKVRVLSVPREPTAEEALLDCSLRAELSVPATNAVVLEHFPGLPDLPIFSSYRDWFRASLAWMAHANPPDRVGPMEVQPGVYAGLHTRISPKATLIPPCWLDESVFVGPGAIVGPDVVLERGAFVESQAQVAHSIVGPATYVGRDVAIDHALAWGNSLLDWESEEETIVNDAFILCSLNRPFVATLRGRWLKRLAPPKPRPEPVQTVGWAAFPTQE